MKRSNKTVAIKYISNAFEDIKNAKKVYREVAILRRLSSMENNIFTVKLLDIVLPWVKGKPMPSGIFLIMSHVS